MIPVVLSITCLVGSLADAARAGTSVDILVPGQPTVTINDGGPLDLDVDPLEIEYDFSVSHPLGYWTATGKVIAKGGDLVPVTTIVTNTLIQKHSGVLLNDEIKVIHYFDSFLTAQPYTAELDGQYDNLVFPTIGVADLTFVPMVNNENIGVIDPPAAIGIPAPSPPFAGASGPLYPSQQPTSQTVLLLFYLDVEGDAIRLFNSAEIKPPDTAIPTLSEWGMILAALLLVVLGATVLRRRRDVHGAL
jgi:hypothetical protein